MKLPALNIPILPERLRHMLASVFSQLSFRKRNRENASEAPPSAVKRRITKGICYTLIGTIAFTFFFLPGYLNNHLDRLLPSLLSKQDALHVQFSNPQIEGFFPPRLTADACRINGKSVKISAIVLKNVMLKPALSGVFAGRAGINFAADGFNGHIAGTVGTSSFSLSAMRLQLAANDIAIEQLPDAKRFLKNAKAVADIDTVLTFTPTKATSLATFLDSASGSLRCSLRRGAMRNIIPLFTPKTIAIASLDANLTFESTRVALQSFSVQSNVVTGELDGTVNINPDRVENSLLSLRGNLRPDPKLTVLELLDPKAVGLIKQGKTISIDISKTLSAPIIKLR